MNEILLTLDGKEATEETKSEILLLEYIDNDEFHADDLQILTRTAGLLSGVSKIKLTLRTDNWHGTGTSRMAQCGEFTVDDNESSYTMRSYVTRAAAITAASAIRHTPKNGAWERIGLKNIAAEIAGRNGVGLIYAAKLNPIFTRKEQRNVSDILFLSDLCKSVGLRLKFTANSLVVYNPYEYGDKTPVATFTAGDETILEDKLHHKKDDTDYQQCRVTYKDPVTKELIQYTYKRTDAGRRLDVRRKVSSTEEAAMVAAYSIKEKNCKEYTGEILCSGDITLATGNIIELSGYGEYDRKYIITKAIHRMEGSEYTTKIFFEMVLEGY